MVTKEYSTLKVGLSYDKVYIGSASNDRIVLVGRAYDDAVDNRTNCCPNEICCSPDFTHKLMVENIYAKTTMYSRKDANGNTPKNMFIDISKIDTRILHQSSHENMTVVRDDEYIEMRMKHE
jgi:hypothetical protein